MAGDSKTEKGTPKRREDERKKGNILLSKDIISVISLLGTFYALKMLFPGIYLDLKEYLFQLLGYMTTITEIDDTTIHELMIGFLIVFIKTTAPILIISIAIAIITTIAQTRFLFSTEALRPKFSRLNPLEGIKRLISLKSLIEILKGMIKISIIFFLLYSYIKGEIAQFQKSLSIDLISSSVFLLEAVMGLVFQVGIALVVISAFDFMYQWWDFERQLKMSKQEIKEEYKQTEGDPQIKGKIKEQQRKMAMSRMMQAVPGADVVVRNPTHFAVALKYDIDKDDAPIVVAKGMDELALRIVKVAEDNHVYIVENKPLARAIYASAEINDEIPMQFYGAIAEMLVYVYGLDKKEK